ncbi:MAG: class I SAM-dependent DNA methyltransferase [Bradymonadaceae bacterium]
MTKVVQPESRNSAHLGVMGADYAEGRLKAKHLGFRYRVRANVAAEAYRAAYPGTAPVRVLELGAAEGLTLLHMRELLGPGGDFLGVELSDSLLAAAPTLPGDTRLIKGDVQSLPEEIQDDAWDLCTALAVIEHLPDPQKLAHEAFRILRPGGVFVATCPNPFWDQVAGFAGLVKDEHHEQPVDMRFLANLAQTAGFESITTRPFMWVVTGFLPYLGVDLDPVLSLRVDEVIEKVKPLHFSFVNQTLIARKPAL